MPGFIYSTNTISSPVWAADFLSPEHLLPFPAKLDPAQFIGTDAVKVSIGANAAQNATSLTVAALLGPLPNGTTLYFGTNKFATLTAAAATGATTLTVAAIPTALTTTDTATYAGLTGVKTVPSGTCVGRTYSERDAGTPFGPVDPADDEVFLVAFDVYDVSKNGDFEVVRHGTAVKENFLPNWANLGTTLQTLIRSKYRCIKGVA